MEFSSPRIKSFLIFYQKQFFLYFEKWNFLAPRFLPRRRFQEGTSKIKKLKKPILKKFLIFGKMTLSSPKFKKL